MLNAIRSQHRFLASRNAGKCTFSSFAPSNSGDSDFLKTLKNQSLWQTTPYINGEFLPPSSSNFDVINPANGKVIASCTRQSKGDVDIAINAADDAFKSWKNTTAKQRAIFLNKLADLVDENKDDLARILTYESGKPLAEAHGEIGYANSFLRLYSEEATRVHGEVLQPNVPGRRMMTIKQPIGLAALITPWNFPSAMITRKLGPALAAGCTVVIKPAELTPLSALALCVLASKAGIPNGVINCLTVGRDEVIDVGTTLCHSTKIRKLSFTGSTIVGKFLYKESSTTIKKLSLELGGNAPFIVFDDCDIDVAIKALINTKFRNTGQTCISSNRIFVQSGIYNKFSLKLKEYIESNVHIGNGLDNHNDNDNDNTVNKKVATAGPLINRQGLDKVIMHVNDCIEKGASVLCGGKEAIEMNTTGGTFYLPTILTNVTTDMRPYYEETFGPIAPLFKFTTEDEVVAMANDTPFGLAAYLNTSNMSRAFRVSEALESGMVGINEGAISADTIPFGGVKQSGLGREGGSWGIDEYLEVKYICFGDI
jgi:succinate-semialdehyde dehydrogenase / glutarate-semialdehyde dehydrogenase